ncbi:hypothetical protein ACXKL1_000850 [Klebsiella oxytoca]|nr:hypothetical protein HMPREF1570_3878 [Klebsiella oxytoca KA-2]EUC90830.1 hypothetical protein HMPREF1569_1141 [Klebsiella oxytoca OK-1]
MPVKVQNKRYIMGCTAGGLSRVYYGEFQRQTQHTMGIFMRRIG